MKKKRCSAVLALLLGLAILFGAAAGAAPADDARAAALGYLREKVPSPAADSVGGEWALIAQARAGQLAEAQKSAYLANLERSIRANATVDAATGAARFSRLTDNARAVLALTSVGIDAARFQEYDLISALPDLAQLQRQGVPAVAYALLALDSGNYLNHSQGGEFRSSAVEWLTGHAAATGGWNLAGSATGAAAPDITGMVLQALAPYSNAGEDAARAAVRSALDALQTMQDADGGFCFEDEGKTAESAAQVLAGLAAMGESGALFDGALGNLLTYQEAGGGFRHTEDGAVNQMATEQAALALVACDRFAKGETALYDMSDVALAPFAPAAPAAPEPKPDSGTAAKHWWKDMNLFLKIFLGIITLGLVPLIGMLSA
ncbi:MAG: hypothetical protein LBG83_05375 [Oscillospiraceae bacterium]|jgi:hypothetical protein|nr:hypothetical protein [Oscillospiraceae bacterium]